jgi:hypothetical protein
VFEKRLHYSWEIGKIHHRIKLENLEGRNHLGDLEVDKKIILK